MFFLLRMGFWLLLVLLALPLGTGDGESVGPVQALMAAKDAIGDIAGLCERKPDVCQTGRAAMHTVGARARQGSQLAFELLDKQGASPVESPDALTTGTVDNTDAGDIVKLPDVAPLPPR